MTILVTGFEPFNNASTNPSWDAVASLPTEIDDNRLVSLQLPVVYDQCWQVLEAAILAHRPQLVVCCGVAMRRQLISLETIAQNIKNATIADNQGILCQGECINSSGPDSVSSQINFKALLNQLKLQDIPCEISTSAGQFVCNNLYYHLLSNSSALGYKGLFVHLPPPQEVPTNVATTALKTVVSTLVALEYCAGESILHDDMVEVMSSKDAFPLYGGPKGLLLSHGPERDYLSMSAPDSDSSHGLLSYLPDGWDCVITHHMYEIDALGTLGPVGYGSRCCIASYSKNTPLPLAENCHIAPLTMEHLDYASMRYHLFRRRTYVAERIQAGEMWGAWVDGRLCGFIGLHEEGAMGLLEVDPDSRRLHLATELESWLINHRLSQGAIPFCQIVYGNHASMGLQARLGLEHSDFQVCWVHPKRESAETSSVVLSDFASKVYTIVSAIPCGKVATYSQVAELAGSPRAARAVGNLLHKNPDPQNIPCWRVVSANGALSKSYAFDGLEGQASRLAQDGVHVTNNKVDLKKYLWKILR